MKFTKKELNIILLFIGILLLLSGCSKNASQNNTDGKNGITASVIEESQENCRLGNESDCSPIEIRRGEPENEQNNSEQITGNIVKTSNKTIDLPEEEINLTNCQQGWKCVETKYKAYQYSNCSWNSIEYCIYGCKDNACDPPPICKSNSLKCDNDNVVKCEDGYEWKLNESCDYRCENGQCINATTLADTTNTTTSQNSTNQSQNTTVSGDYITDKCINIKNFNYDAAGPDNSSNLNDEYFTLKNSCSYSIAMTSWTAKDASNHVFTFPSFNLDISAEVSVHTGSGTANSTDLYWGRGSHVWNNDGDTLYLNDSKGQSVLIYSYT